MCRLLVKFNCLRVAVRSVGRGDRLVVRLRGGGADDGMSLPYGHLVDWPQARLALPESLAKNFSAVVETVAAVSKGRKARMRAKVRRIYDECMATDAKLADCFLRDLSLAVRAPRNKAALRAAESSCRRLPPVT